MTASKGATSERRRPGNESAITRRLKVLCTPGRHPPAVPAQQAPGQGDVSGARSDQGVAHRQASSHLPLRVGQPMRRAIRAEQTGLLQGPGVSSISLDLPGRVAYIGAKFGSATTTSWPKASRHRATHSLSVEASTRIRARGRPSNTSANRWGSVRMRRSITSPVSVSRQIWLSFLCRSMPTTPWLALSCCAHERVCSQWGTVCHHVELGVSRFIPSTLRRR